MGLEGAKYLSQSFVDMKILNKLVLSDNEIGDQGMTDILDACRNYCTLEYLDVSGNNLGKSSAALDMAESMNEYLSTSRSLEVLKINWNSLRAVPAERIIQGILECTGLKQVHFNNNLIGVSYDDKQPPVNKMAELLSSSKNLE